MRGQVSGVRFQESDAVGGGPCAMTTATFEAARS